MNFTRSTFFILLAGFPLPVFAELSFNRDIRPILADACFNCHGADEKTREAKLRLDQKESAYADRDGFRAVVPGDLEESELIYRIFTDEEDEVMPPVDHPHQITKAQKEILKQWIKEGGKYEGHWAFSEPKKSEPVKKTDWAKNTIDHFIHAGLTEAELTPQPEADKTTLIRRLYLDLTGLPPTPAEVDRFLADTSPDAYEKLVDRILASPHYGERMATWWLDGARYADSHGFQADWERYQWPWRDWVIRAFNDNMPFDQFTIEQLAGDLLPNATNSQIVATGFNRNHRINTEGGALNEEWLIENVIDRVETTGSVWMGLTFNCCRCHDHKYDPISQQEFYEFFAFFNNVPEQGKGPGKAGNFTPVISVEDPGLAASLATLKNDISQAEAELKKEQDRIIPSLTKSSLSEKKSSWALVRKLKAASKGGATFSPQSDGSYLVTGKSPALDTRTLTFQVGPKPITAFRLEALANPSFPNKGFARGHNGNFVLNGVSARIMEGKKKPVAVKLARALATYEQKGYPIKNALDGKKNTGWAVDGNSKPHDRAALFEVRLPAPTQSQTNTPSHAQLPSHPQSSDRSFPA